MSFSFERDSNTTVLSVESTRETNVDGLDERDGRGLHCATSEKTHSRLDNRITARDSITSKLPDELTTDDGSPLSLFEAREAYDHHLAGEYNNNKDGFVNTFEHRGRSNYANILREDRRIRDEFSDCHIATLTLTGKPTDDEGNWLPSLDFMHDVSAGVGSVFDSLRYSLREQRSAFFGVLAGNDERAIPHWHIVAYSEGAIEPELIHRAQSKHVEHSPVALERDHTIEHVRVEKASHIEMKPIGKEDRDKGLVSPAARYVASQVPHIAGASRKHTQKEHGATVWGYSGSHFRSGGAFERFEYDDDEESDSNTAAIDEENDDEGDEKESSRLHCAKSEKSENSSPAKPHDESDDDKFAYQKEPRGLVYSYQRDEPPGVD